MRHIRIGAWQLQADFIFAELFITSRVVHRHLGRICRHQVSGVSWRFAALIC
jgi:hypothetical protein